MPDAQKITPDDVKNAARLARLSLDDAAVSRLAAQLQSILGYVNKIGEVNVADVQPLAHALPLHNVLREDVPGPALSLDKVLQNAPDAEPPFFKVPKVIGGDEDSAG